MTAIEHLFIVGAGFSSYAGLPLTNQFTKKLLDVKGLKLDGPSNRIVPFLQKFVENTFGHLPKSSPNDWPHLEDIFTCIDLSANTGPHLGPNYSPSDLRTVRRALIVRIILMLRHTYTQRRDNADSNWKTLEGFFSSVVSEKCAFLMNLDTVIEEGLGRTQGISYSTTVAMRRSSKSRLQSSDQWLPRTGPNTQTSRLRELAVLRRLPSGVLD